MDESESPSLAWEHKAALGCLGLLILQEIQEGYLFCVGEAYPGFQRTSSNFRILLVVYFSIGMGLWTRSRTTGWFAVILIGGIGLVLFGELHSFELTQLYIDEANASPHLFDKPLQPYEVFYRPMIRVGLHFLVPALLLLGELRQAVHAPTA